MIPLGGSTLLFHSSPTSQCRSALESPCWPTALPCFAHRPGKGILSLNITILWFVNTHAYLAYPDIFLDPHTSYTLRNPIRTSIPWKLQSGRDMALVTLLPHFKLHLQRPSLFKRDPNFLLRGGACLFLFSGTYMNQAEASTSIAPTVIHTITAPLGLPQSNPYLIFFSVVYSPPSSQRSF